MVSQDFKNFVVKVRETLLANGIHAGTYELLSIADALYVGAPEESLDSLLTRAHNGDRTHELLVQIALKDDGRPMNCFSFGGDDTTTVTGWVVQGKKIHAIKRLRSLAVTGLREAKEAVEDPRVSVF